MKKNLLALTFLFSSVFGFAQTTATQFNVTDCSGTTHDLFAELDAGKVIVISWVMPCGSCFGPSSTAYNIVQSYATSNPGMVKFYLSSDTGTDGCSNITGWWETTNSMPAADATFSNTAVIQGDYGTPGMPKIVVLGGTAHTVFFNANNSAAGNTTNITNAINNALAAGVGIENPVSGVTSAGIFPNPANDITDFSYFLEKGSEIAIQVFNILGDNVKTIYKGKQNAGNYNFHLDCSDLRNGLYFVKFIANEKEQTIKFSVSH